jgi:hypothetical protein
VWPLVREGFLVYRRQLVWTWVVTTAGIATVFAVLAVVGVVPAAKAPAFAVAAWPAYVILASAVTGFIAFGVEQQDRRLRFHALLPLPARSIGLAQLLLPVALLLPGLVLAHAIAAAVVLNGVPRAGWVKPSLLDLIAAHVLFVQAAVYLSKEITVLRDRSVGWATAGSFLVSALAVVDLLMGQPGGRPLLHAAAVLALAVLTAACGLFLFERRPELTR